MILEFSCPGGAWEPISPTQLQGCQTVTRWILILDIVEHHNMN